MEFIYEKLGLSSISSKRTKQCKYIKKEFLTTQDGNHGQQKNVEKLSTINTSHNLIFHFDLQKA